jgi:hypothetical protein
MWIENTRGANFGSGRMKRLVNIISGVFLVVAVLIGGCGVASFRDHRVLIHRRFDAETNMRVNAVASCEGAVWIFSKVHFRRPGINFFVIPGWYFGPGSFSMDDRPWGRPHYSKENNRGAYGHMLVLPHWLVALLCLMLGFPSMNSVRRRLRERRWISRKQCSKCRYDMRFSGERCPECGEMVVKRPMEQRAAEV